MVMVCMSNKEEGDQHGWIDLKNQTQGEKITQNNLLDQKLSASKEMARFKKKTRLVKKIGLVNHQT
jgi:hypothetical protein